MLATDGKSLYLKIDTAAFINIWVNYLKKCEKNNQPTNMLDFANLIADRAQEDPRNIEYVKAYGKFSGEKIQDKVINKCRAVNASLKRKYEGKTLPIPKRASVNTRPKAHEILEGIDGALDLLK